MCSTLTVNNTAEKKKSVLLIECIFSGVYAQNPHAYQFKGLKLVKKGEVERGK
jgi:hypothetical protein